MDNKDPETMNMDELRALALENWEQPQEQPTQDQPRDDQGRFTKTEPEEEVVFQRVIDLGDGSGTQVFEGKTLEELIDKLAKAQEHATRKIREQAHTLKEREKPAVESKPPAQMTEAEKFLLQQRMLTDPQSVIDEYVTRQVTELERQREEKAAETVRRQEAIETAAQAWVDSTPDYFANEKNGTKIQKWLVVNQLDPTAENFQKAFEDLNSSGLLEPRPAETTAETVEEAPKVRRIVEPTVATTTVRRKVVGGLSTKRSAPVEQAAPGLTEDELYKLPMDQLERMTIQHWQNRN
jgi:hypothetical protein